MSQFHVPLGHVPIGTLQNLWCPNFGILKSLMSQFLKKSETCFWHFKLNLRIERLSHQRRRRKKSTVPSLEHDFVFKISQMTDHRSKIWIWCPNWDNKCPNLCAHFSIQDCANWDIALLQNPDCANWDNNCPITKPMGGGYRMELVEWCSISTKSVPRQRRHNISI